MPNSRLQQQLEIVASAPNAKDFLSALEAMMDDVSDVRTDIGKPDSMEVRQGVTRYLRQSVDSILRIRKNRTARRGEAPADEAGE